LADFDRGPRPKNETAVNTIADALEKTILLDPAAYFLWSRRDVYQTYGIPDDHGSEIRAGVRHDLWFYNVNDTRSVGFRFADGIVEDVFLSGFRPPKTSHK